MRAALAERAIVFLVPGELASLTGGYAYDRQIIAGLRDTGWQVRILAAGEGFPWPDARTQAALASRIAGLPDGSTVVADGLAMGAMPDIVQAHGQRLDWVALVHHPLALETGCSALQSQQLFDSERRALRWARRVIVTSRATARALRAYGVHDSRISVVEPGTSVADVVSRRDEVKSLTDGGHSTPARTLNLLCVATVTARKGHAVLIEALAGLQDRPWALHCAGSTTRDRDTAATVRTAVAAHGLDDRVHLHGEVDAVRLAELYARAEVFVLPSFHEGYGMVLAKALAHGLPIVSTTAGAIPDTVPTEAGLLAPPGDVLALREALRRMMDDPALRVRLAEGARAARTRLPDWPQAVERFGRALTHNTRSPHP